MDPRNERKERKNCGPREIVEEIDMSGKSFEHFWATLFSF